MTPDGWLDLYDLLDNVQELLDLGLIDSAQETLDKYETTFFDCWEYHFLYSRVYSELDQPRKAVSSLLQGLRLERDNSDCLVSLFYAYAQMGRVKRGGKFLLRAAEVDPDYDLAWSALIWYYTDTNELDKALECYTKAVKINSNNPDTYRNAGIVFDRLGRYDEAEECYREALTISPNFEEARDLYADHLISRGRPEEAIKLYNEALRNSPNNVRHMSRLVYCFSQNGSMDEAAELSKRSIETYPNSPTGYIDLAYVMLNTDQIEEAERYADAAIAISPLDAEGYKVKAIACSDLERDREAEKLFEKAISLDPENTDILRDYYHHLRAAEKYDQMVAVVNKAIKADYPYCAEDYWFLADYYREMGHNLKAFRYLRMAYDNMPAEKELLPPMIEILLEAGHTKYCLPVFADYVQRSGWTDAMSGFTKNRQFKDAATQEGMRFLRFTGQRPMAFRKYIFDYYFYRFGLIYYTLIVAALTFPAAVLFGWRGVGGAAAFYVLSLAGVKIAEIVRFRMMLAKAEGGDPYVRGAP